MQQTTDPCDPTLSDLLARGVEIQASDLHLVVGYPPTYRVHGQLRPTDADPLSRPDLERMIASAVPAPIKSRAEARQDVDFSLTLDLPGDMARFRVNAFFAGGEPGACLRFIPRTIPAFEWMGFPPKLVQTITNLHGGLVLITGVTGSGKTTTLAGLVQALNELGHRRIITIEEPIEYVFQPAPQSVITQREVGVDVPSFAQGLKSSLRQDPDVILCGEIRDIETARMAISAAETGHLVMSTVHTQDAKGAITRLVDVFPADQQQEIRGQLSLSLKLVISQLLVPAVDPTAKRVLALEILVMNDPVRAAIRQNKIESIDSLIQIGKKQGMQTIDEHLASHVVQRRITAETAHRFAKNPDGLRGLGVQPPTTDGVSDW